MPCIIIASMIIASIGAVFSGKGMFFGKAKVFSSRLVPFSVPASPREAPAAASVKLPAELFCILFSAEPMAFIHANAKRTAQPAQRKKRLLQPFHTMQTGANR